MTIIPDLWLRLHFLVPEPQCRTFADDFDRLIWNDVRTQPTAVDLRAVTAAQLDSVNPSKIRDTDRISGISKLKTSVGLTDAEIKALGF